MKERDYRKEPILETCATHGEPAAEPGRGEDASCCLVRAHDAMRARPDLDGEGIQLWLDFEEAALERGVDPDVTREELAAGVGCSSCRPMVAAAPPGSVRSAEAA